MERDALRMALEIIAEDQCEQAAVRDDGLTCRDPIPGSRSSLEPADWCMKCVADYALRNQALSRERE